MIISNLKDKPVPTPVVTPKVQKDQEKPVPSANMASNMTLKPEVKPSDSKVENQDYHQFIPRGVSNYISRTVDTDIDLLSFTATSAATWYHVSGEVDLSGIATATGIKIYTDTALSAADYVYVKDIKATDAFSGDSDNRWSHAIITDVSLFTHNGASALVISNNVQNLFYFEGHAGDRFVEWSLSTTPADFSNFANAKEIIEFWNHFFLINYNNGSTYVRSLAYSGLGNADAFTIVGSGSQTLTDTIGKLLRAKKLGSDLILYSEKSITTARYLGQTVLFTFPTLVYETGLFAEKGIWDSVNAHYFLGTDQKIYAYAGGQQLIPIGAPIEDSFFSELDASKKSAICLGLDPSKHKLYFNFAGASNDYAQQAYVYNFKAEKRSWEYHIFADSIRDFSIFTSQTGWYADGPELAGTYADDLVFYADASMTQNSFPQPIFLSHDGYIYKLDEVSGKDNETNIIALYTTHDLTADMEENYFRTAWVSFNLMSTKASGTYDIYYSTDGGAAWNVISANNSISEGLANKWTQHRHPVDIVARKVRFAILQQSAKDLQIRSGHIRFQLQTDRE